MKGLPASPAWPLLALAALWPSTGRACGACVEDRVALVYDHALAKRAAAGGNVVVFCDVVGPFDLARLKSAARGARGVKAHSLRASQQPAVLSFVIESQSLSPEDAVKGMQRALGTSTQLRIVHLLKPAPGATR